jgi:putative membrane protein
MAQEAIIDMRARSPGIDTAVPILLVACGVLLWWAATFHVTSLPIWAPWDFSWLWYLAATFTAWWYVRGLALGTAGERPSAWRIASFAIGMLAIWAVLQTRYEYLAEHMFFLNRFQHLVMHHLGPFLIVLGWPGATIRRGMPAPTRRLLDWRGFGLVMRVVQQPILAAFLFVGLIALWLTPPVHFRAMVDPELYAFMNWTMVVDGVLFWALVLDPRPSPPAFGSFGARAAAAVAIIIPQIVIGAVISFAGTDLYAFYAWCGRIFPSIGAVDDQIYGGLIVWIPASMMSLIGLLLVINNLRLSDKERENADGYEAETGGVVISSKGWTG